MTRLSKIAECPFCGRPGTRTKEHVWAQWLHETYGGRELLKGSHGETVQNNRTVMTQGADGRYQTVTSANGYVNVDLPHVTVAVCVACNSEWMSGLESKAQDILSPFVFENGQITFRQTICRTSRRGLPSHGWRTR